MEGKGVQKGQRYNSRDKKPINAGAINGKPFNARAREARPCLGRVKFFDDERAFGFIRELDGETEYFVHGSKLLSPICEGAIVSFESTPSNKKPGEFDAIQVSTKLQAFIFNSQDNPNKSVAIVFANEIIKKFELETRLESGFKVVLIVETSNQYGGSILDGEGIAKAESIIASHSVYSYLLSDPVTFEAAGQFGDSLCEGLCMQALNPVCRKLSFLESYSLKELRARVPVLKNYEFFTYVFLKRCTQLNKISFLYWLDGAIATLPQPRTQGEVDIWKYGILPQLEWSEIQEVVLKLYAEVGASAHVEATYKFLIKKGWVLNLNDGFEKALSFLTQFRRVFPHIELSESNFTISTTIGYIRLWQQGIISQLPEETLKEHIRGLPNGERAEFIDTLEEKDALLFFSELVELKDHKENYLRRILDREFSVDTLCLDIESDGVHLREFAWMDTLGIHSHRDFASQEEGIKVLTDSICSSNLIIGQNIKEFDLPILEKNGFLPVPTPVWDTLEFEMLLNPCRFSYGLRTEHTATGDAKLTYALFKNQVMRIALDEELFLSIYGFLPKAIQDLVTTIRISAYFSFLEVTTFVQESNTFFRPNPKYKNIPADTYSQLDSVLKKLDKFLLIAPEILWATLSSQFQLDFYRGSRQPFFYFSEESIDVNFSEDNFNGEILRAFVRSCRSKGRKPYLDLLPQAIKSRLTEKKLWDVVKSTNLEDIGASEEPFCISPIDLPEIAAFIADKRDHRIIVVGHEIYQLTAKLQLGQDYDFSTIFDRLKSEPVWVQMSGGKSFVPLQIHHCKLLGIEQVPEDLANIWLEKIDKGKFRVYCNLNLKTILDYLGDREVTYVSWTDRADLKKNTVILRPDAKRSYIAEQKRVNPESLNRSLYWVYQFKLIANHNSKSSKVILINDKKETVALMGYARAIGYFIPDINATLARQVEILHAHNANRKLMIVAFEQLEDVLSANYEHSIDVIWESFLLREKYQMLANQTSVDYRLRQENEDELREQQTEIQNEFDVFTLIKRHTPLIDYYSELINDNNPNSSLLLCDPRLVDFFGIEKSLKTNSLNVPMWQKEAEYEIDRKLAAEYFKSADKGINVEFDPTEAKEILRHIFLKTEDGSSHFPWKDYQHLCLDEILPAKQDLLVSLPTGAGKSLLFQGPALFRSAFSSCLSIVITPLRALMQDQVSGLWQKGFYSNVDYLSGDKSQIEIKDIYRRISGGEITLLFITPERFRSRAFENCILTRLDSDGGFEFAVFDEAHCISQWGQEFRPDYLNSAKRVAELSLVYKCRKLLFSATISEQVFEQILDLMPGVRPVEGTEKSYNPVRDHIKINFKHNVVDDERLIEIGNYLKTGGFDSIKSRAIVFVKSRKKAEECASLMPDVLRRIFGSEYVDAEKVGSFHAGMDFEDRNETYEKYRSGDVVLLFATKAFGMGMDIGNIHFVTHYSPPSTFEDFLQEVGRAGRNEKDRKDAGFIDDRSINTLCLAANGDFASLKDQLHQSRISWHEIKEIKTIVEKYINKFRTPSSNKDIPVALPLDLYTTEKANLKDDVDTKFRVGLHWLEKLERIKLGYLTITHLEIEAASLHGLEKKLTNCPDKESGQVCKALLKLYTKDREDGLSVQFSIASLRSDSKLSLENLFRGLLKLHKLAIIKLLQQVVIHPTKLRLNETNYCRKDRYTKYPALRVVFAFAYKILEAVPLSESRVFEGEYLDELLEECLTEVINFEQLPWCDQGVEKATSDCVKYIDDIRRKRSKHAFSILKVLGKITHESNMEKLLDSLKPVTVRQSIFNGYHKRNEWVRKIEKLEEDCIELLDYLCKRYFEANESRFNWADIMSELGLDDRFQYLSDILFILSMLGYVRTAGLLPSGIEVYTISDETIAEEDLQSNDKLVFEEFEQTRKVRELKLIALEALAGFQKAGKGLEGATLRGRQDSFIRKYFACNSMESLLQLLQEELPPNDPMLVKWRGDAIKDEEGRLNKEQRLVYDSILGQHISVMAGPGSGKTHTLTLRVARLIHHAGVPPEEILVLAYNRAVVSELKERLGKLFSALGYGNLSKRIKIHTFHGLAKKFCEQSLADRPFDEWEDTLLDCLGSAPGEIMTRLAPLKYILVDEFQDINRVRINLLQRLFELTRAHLFIIGDPNQSIYGYERKKEGGSMSPWPYYQEFNEIFKPAQFQLYDNHRSYPMILKLASDVLKLSPEHQNLIPKPTRQPDRSFMADYAQVFDWNAKQISWWEELPKLLIERVGEKQLPYKQIAVLFRTNNEVYRGFQKVKSLNLANVRIRIQGSLPYEFSRIRECFEVINYLRAKSGQAITSSFNDGFGVFIRTLIESNPNWNHFYIRVIHAIVIEFQEEENDSPIFEDLLDYINELTRRDDGQLYKIYEKHAEKVAPAVLETEIVLTTMHKVKGLEYDAVVVPPSFVNLPLKADDNYDDVLLQEQLDEERRLAFVAYTRARYRLIVIKHNRENALERDVIYIAPDHSNSRLGIAAQPEIKKLNIGWAANEWSFTTQRVNEFIRSSVKSGDVVNVRSRQVNSNYKSFTVYELVKDGKVVGELSKNSGIIGHSLVSGFVVNEIVVWSYEDTCKYDSENDADFGKKWCEQAKEKGYIYLVDFAGYGTVEN